MVLQNIKMFARWKLSGPNTSGQVEDVQIAVTYTGTPLHFKIHLWEGFVVKFLLRIFIFCIQIPGLLAGNQLLSSANFQRSSVEKLFAVLLVFIEQNKMTLITVSRPGGGGGRRVTLWIFGWGFPQGLWDLSWYIWPVNSFPSGVCGEEKNRAFFLAFRAHSARPDRRFFSSLYAPVGSLFTWLHFAILF